MSGNKIYIVKLIEKYTVKIYEMYGFVRIQPYQLTRFRFVYIMGVISATK
jgi:hypothetical protein